MIKKLITIAVSTAVLSVSVGCSNSETSNKAESVQEQSRIQSYIASIKQKNAVNSPDVLTLKSEISEITNRFVNLARRQGYELAYVPQVEVIVTKQLMFFAGDKKEGVIVAPNWSGLPPKMKRLFSQWMKESNSELAAEMFFKKNFNWFLVPHELGHYLQNFAAQEKSSQTRWQRELSANKTAIKFWLAQGQSKQLAAFIKETSKLSNYLKTQLPQEIDESYFNDNYRQLVANPVAYGYVQFKMYQMAWDEISLSNQKQLLD